MNDSAATFESPRGEAPFSGRPSSLYAFQGRTFSALNAALRSMRIQEGQFGFVVCNSHWHQIRKIIEDTAEARKLSRKRLLRP